MVNRQYSRQTLFAVNSVKGGVCKTRTGYLRMRIGKCGKTPKKVKRMRREIRMAKISKQTKERNLSFKSLSHGWDLHVQNSLSIVGPGYPVFFLNSLNPVIPFINVTETRALRSSSLKPRMLWYTSPLST